MDRLSHRFYARESESLSPMKSPPASSLFGTPLHYSSQTSFPIIAVAIIGILATAFLLVGYYIFVIKCCLNWHRIDLLRRFSFSRNRPAEDPLMVYSPVLVENRGLNEAAIRSIPLFKFRKSDTQNDDVSRTTCECAVCLNEFQEDEKLRIIPNCGHVFHIDCIDVWLQNNANCPLCRTSISANRHDMIHFQMDQILGPTPSPQDHPNPDTDNDNDDDYVVIEIRSERDNNNNLNHSLPRFPERLNSNELSTISPKISDTKSFSRKKVKKLSHTVSSMGDECIDNRKKDEQFLVQPIRRSFSMDSAADSQLYLAVQDIIMKHRQVNTEVSPIEEGSSNRVIKRSFFSFGQGRGSRTAVQPVTLDS